MPHFALKYLRREALPTPFCPGCFNGIVMNAMFRAFERLGIESLDRFVFVSGIGCSSWIPNPHIAADTVHTLHGRAIPVATGIKLARPDLEVIVIAGDGDLAAIGGNHLIHAARRNMDLIVVMITNLVYAMTRGQVAPTTPLGMKTPTTPFGNPEPPMDVAELLSKTNANYVARWCVSNFSELVESFIDVLHRVKRGFRFIEVYAPCITYVARYRGLTPAQMLRELEKVCREGGEVRVGVFVKRDEPGFIDRYRAMVEGVKRC